MKRQRGAKSAIKRRTPKRRRAPAPAKRQKHSPEYYREYYRRWYARNRARLLPKMREYYGRNRKPMRSAQAAYYKEHRTEIRAWQKKYSRIYRRKNAAKREAYQMEYDRRPEVKARKRARFRSDPQYAIRLNLGRAMSRLYRIQLLSPRCNLDAHLALVGCTMRVLKAHIEKNFRPGMSWKNISRWEIDHIRPVTSFDLTNRTQCSAAFHYKNVRPIWPIENKRKGAR